MNCSLVFFWSKSVLKVFALAVKYSESKFGFKSCCIVCSALGSLPAFLCLSFAAEGFAYPSHSAEVFVRVNVTCILTCILKSRTVLKLRLQ